MSRETKMPGTTAPGTLEDVRYDDDTNVTSCSRNQTQPMIEAALQWAAEGVDVFPVHPTTKRPLLPAAHSKETIEGFTCRGECGHDGHGFHDATTDTERIIAWWTRWPDASIGAPTGRRFDVLDVDTKDLTEACADIPSFSGVHVETRKGHHFYMRPTGLGRRVRFARLIDWLGTNGYVVLPPSVGYQFEGTPRDMLEALPEASPELVKRATPRELTSVERTPSRRPKYQPPRQYNPNTGGAPTGVGLVRTVEQASKGSRNSVLWWAARIVGLEVHDGKRTQDSASVLLDELHDAALRSGLGDSETTLTIRSGFARGVSGIRGRVG